MLADEQRGQLHEKPSIVVVLVVAVAFRSSNERVVVISCSNYKVLYRNASVVKDDKMLPPVFDNTTTA